MALTLPRTLSPSKVSSFTDCALAFRFSIIDHLPEPPSAPAVKGTLVHLALEKMFWNHPKGQRTIDAALGELTAAWDELQTDDELLGLELNDDEAEAFRADAATLLTNYFELEDPNAVNAVAMELGLEVSLGDLRLRGIIDRLDLNDDGEFVVIDYKTGRAPSERFEHGKLNGVHLYAMLCEQIFGRPPAEVRLLHLREPLAIVASPNAQSIRGQERRTVAVWNAIERACAREDFRPRRSARCGYCPFQQFCPEFGGQMPELVAS